MKSTFSVVAGQRNGNGERGKMDMHLTMPNMKDMLQMSDMDEIDLYSKKNHPNQIKDSMILDSVFDKYYPSRNQVN